MHGTIDSLFRVEWRPLTELAPIAAEWRDLAARALAPNVFYEPAFALAAAPVFGDGVGTGLVWSRGSPARLLGLFPARIERARYGVPLPVLVGWTHPYAPFGAPLVDRDNAEAVIGAWFSHIEHEPALPKRLLFPYFPEADALARTFDAVIARRDGRSAFYARHARALLAPGDARAGYLDRTVGHRKRKEVRRQRKRLAELGAITDDSTGEPSTIMAALMDFLTLEASGWKGRAGTAAHADPGIRAFLTAAVAALAHEGKARVDRLLVGGRPIAATITLRSGNTAWGWKIAYDEAFARFSPGTQLLLDISQAILDDSGVVQADSCATAGHPLIDHVWRERLPLADRLVAIGPGHSLAFAAACRLETARRAAISGAKSLRHRLRKR